ncbi:MAG: recombinase family protein [Candidatus Eisenbacteria sp.]|nr:recombinase family protein [Candidatus Eisenbacteria bacterium]
MKRAVLYARVSTAEQAERAKSVPEQLEACREYCEVQGWEVAGEWSDPGVSGTLRNRPDLRRALAYVEDHRPDVFLVWSHSRLARSLNAFYSINATLEANGVALVAADDPQASYIVRAVMMLASQIMIEETKASIRRAKRGIASRLEFPGGKPPFGFRLERQDDDKNVLVSDPDEARTIRRVFSWADPEAEGRQLTEIAQSVGWTRGRLHNTLRHPVYAGGYVFGRRPVVGQGPTIYPRQKSIPRGEWLATVTWNHHEPLVPREQWERVWKRLDRNAQSFNAGHNYGRTRLALSGRLRCGLCGQAIATTGKAPLGPGIKRRYFRCVGNMTKSAERKRAKKCRGVGSFHIDGWAGWILSAVHDKLANSDLAKQIATDLERDRTRKRPPKKLRAEVRKWTQKEKQFLQAIGSREIKNKRDLYREYDAAATERHKAEQALADAQREQGDPITLEQVQRELIRTGSELLGLVQVAQRHDAKSRKWFATMADRNPATLKWLREEYHRRGGRSDLEFEPEFLPDPDGEKESRIMHRALAYHELRALDEDPEVRRKLHKYVESATVNTDGTLSIRLDWGRVFETSVPSFLCLPEAPIDRSPRSSRGERGPPGNPGRA